MFGWRQIDLLPELKRRCYAVVEEPGRRIVAEESKNGSTGALPWVDLADCHRAKETSRNALIILRSLEASA